MTAPPLPFRYVGPPELAAGATSGDATGQAIGSPADLARWAATLQPAELAEPVTYVVSLDGVLRLAPRRSEHVACAGGVDVLAAGELGLARGSRHGWEAHEITNLSTGYCPDPDCWPAVADALGRAGIAHPGRFTHAFDFRRCPNCGQRSVVKDADFTCAVCGTALPARWNVDPTNPRTPDAGKGSATYTSSTTQP